MQKMRIKDSPQPSYLMENEEESIRLASKTDEARLRAQALWAGIKPGMRVADIGCGSGRTTAALRELVDPEGSVIGVDFSADRLDYAGRNYGGPGIEFRQMNILDLPDGLGGFDFVWARFLLEYYSKESFEIARKLTSILKPGGILCLIDLDYNCLTHYGLSERLEAFIRASMKKLQAEKNFDPYVGRKLYSYLYDLDYRDIRVDMQAHHLIYGELNPIDAFNWFKKMEIALPKAGPKEFEGEYGELVEEFKTFFSDPRRFTYTPLICCAGIKPE
jgi:ubiquinone/menaquinone biosynthesis C-methylase UbiE